MIALPAAADECEGVAAMGVADCGQAPGDVVERFVPADRLEAAVVLTLQRLAQAIIVVLVVIEPCGLLAEIALRHRM